MNVVNTVGETKKRRTTLARLDSDLLTWILVEIFPVSAVLTCNTGKVQGKKP